MTLSNHISHYICKCVRIIFLFLTFVISMINALSFFVLYLISVITSKYYFYNRFMFDKRQLHVLECWQARVSPETFQCNRNSHY